MDTAIAEGILQEDAMTAIFHYPKKTNGVENTRNNERAPKRHSTCNGLGSDDEGWREGCETCLRRTAPRPDHVWMIKPPAIIAFECEFLIEPK